MTARGEGGADGQLHGRPGDFTFGVGECMGVRAPGTALASIGHQRVEPALAAGVANLSTMMMTVEPMSARGAHYTALLETIDHRGATKLHAREREQLLEAADALLFGEPEGQRLLRSAEELIESLETSERWSAESCDQLREHLYGCDGAAGAAGAA